MLTEVYVVEEEAVPNHLEGLGDVGVELLASMEVGRVIDEEVAELFRSIAGDLDQPLRDEAGPVEEEAELAEVHFRGERGEVHVSFVPLQDHGVPEQGPVVETTFRLPEPLDSLWARHEGPRAPQLNKPISGRARWDSNPGLRLRRPP